MGEMKLGMLFSLISGIVTLVAIFLFTLTSFTAGESTYYVSGIMGILRILEVFVYPYNIVYIFTSILLLILLFSGVIQILGMKYRALSFLGSILPLFFGIVLIIGAFGVLSGASGALYLLGNDQLIEGVIPFHIPILDTGLTLGSIILLAGGILGIVSGILNKGDI